MTRKEELEKEIKALQEKLAPMQTELTKLRWEESQLVESKIKRCEHLQDSFQLDELLFAAAARCSCGAGMAYPIGSGMNGSWICSAILLGRAERGSKHDSNLPFAFYEIKSENQPSANGATTRPEKEV